jgi:drug/metabolite transporter (DMT)-like permease
MKRTEKIAIVLIIGAALQGPASLLLLQYYIPSLLEEGRLSFFQQSLGFAATAARSLVAIACALWLFFEAKRQKQSRWIWCLLGLLFQLPAVAVFYGFAILERLNTPSDANNSIHTTV